MQKHPDADSFVRAHLRRPTDATTRLVFADWLEETGAPSNIAWAHYIRLLEEAERFAPDAIERWSGTASKTYPVTNSARPTPMDAGGILHRASIFASKVRAKLTLAARAFARNPEAVLQLLPPANVTVRLAGFEAPRAVAELVPESVARENVMMPFVARGLTLFAATTHPYNSDTAQKLQFILSRPVVFLGAEQTDVQDAIDRAYGRTEIVSVGSVLWAFSDGFPIVAPSDPAPDSAERADSPVVRLVNLILAEAISGRADRILIAPDLDSVTVRFRVASEWITRNRIPTRLLRPVAARLARRALIPLRSVFADPPDAEPHTGAFVSQIHDAQHRIRVTILPSPDGPTTQVDLIREATDPA